MPTEYKPINPGNWDQLNEYIAELTTNQDIDTILTSVASVEYHNVGDPGEPPFLNGFRNYGDVWAPARWRLAANSTLRLDGLVCRDAPLTAAADIFVLPPEARPDASLMFAVASDNGTISRVDVHASGEVQWRRYLVGPSGAEGHVSLSGIGYSVAP